MCIWFYQFVFEGMEESGSEGLDDLIAARKDTFFKVCGIKQCNFAN